MRGKARRRTRTRARNRITPACAGKSVSGLLSSAVSGDHPRMCGEKIHHNGYYTSEWGSPPHVRGKADVCSTLEIPPRITPACAGKSLTIPKLTTGSWDHPRMCGEKPYYTTLPRGFQGSPPHVRGKAMAGAPQGGLAGITPACAGKSTAAFEP